MTRPHTMADRPLRRPPEVCFHSGFKGPVLIIRDLAMWRVF